MLMTALVFLYTTGKGWVYRDISIDDFLVSKEGGQSCYELADLEYAKYLTDDVVREVWMVSTRTISAYTSIH
jgi:hypothetical protein